MTCAKTARLSGRATASPRPRATSAARAEGSVNDTGVLSSRAPLVGASSRLSVRVPPEGAGDSAVADAVMCHARAAAAVTGDELEPIATARRAPQGHAAKAATPAQHQPVPTPEQCG